MEQLIFFWECHNTILFVC